MQYDRSLKPSGAALDGPADLALKRAWDAGQLALDEHEAKAALRGIGIATPRGVKLAAGRAATGSLADLKPPFVLKALSSEPIHKSDIGAIRLDLRDEQAVDEARSDIAARMKAAGLSLTGFLVEEMIAPGCEMILGGMHDPKLGPMVMVGAGGIFAEVLGDAIFGLCPISRVDAAEMVESLKILPILQGARGRTPVHITPLVDALLALGGENGLFWRHADKILEFDINPVIVRADGMAAVDARFVLKAAS